MTEEPEVVTRMVLQAAEGVRAALADKDNVPRWDPQTLDSVGVELLDEIFAPLASGREWTALLASSPASVA